MQKMLCQANNCQRNVYSETHIHISKLTNGIDGTKSC